MNSAEWSWTSCRVDRPALAAATDHNPARFGTQLSCVTPPPWGRQLTGHYRICLRVSGRRVSASNDMGSSMPLDRATKSLEHIRMDVLRVERTSPAARKSAVDHPLHGFWVAVALDLHAG